MSSLKYRILLISLLVITSMELQAKSYNSWHLLYPDTYGVIKKIKDPKPVVILTSMGLRQVRKLGITKKREP